MWMIPLFPGCYLRSPSSGLRSSLPSLDAQTLIVSHAVMNLHSSLRLAVPALVMFVASPLSAEEPAPAVNYQKLIIGTWKFELKLEGYHILGITTYLADGTAQARGEFVIEGEKTHFTAEAKWSIKGDKLSGEITKTSDPEFMELGEKWTDTIVSIDDKEFQYIDEEGDKKIEKRVPEEKEKKEGEEPKKEEPKEATPAPAEKK